MFKAAALMEVAGTDMHAVNDAIGQMAQMISLIESDYLRGEYMDSICADFKKIKIASLKRRVNMIRKEREDTVETVEVVQAPVNKSLNNPIELYIRERSIDGILYKADVLLQIPDNDTHAENEALGRIAEMLAILDSDFLRDEYVSKIVAKHKKVKAPSLIKRVGDLEKRRKEAVQELAEKERAIPSWINTERFWTAGFDAKIDGVDKTGFWFHMGKDGARRMTNFVMTPLIHIYSKDENANRRLTEVHNGRSKAILELPSKAFSSVDQFESILMNEGVYFTMDGFTKSHLNKLKAELLGEYPKCFELKTLGWQPEGFWAYSNKIYKDSLVSFNEYGFTEIDGVNYLSMAASEIKGEFRAEDDLYENDRFLQWSKPSIDFSEWSKMMVGAYGDNGKIGIMYAFVSLFRDIVYALNSSCPHLYAHGPVGSGKSAYAESISNLFFKEMKFFNLNQGTDFAFFNRLERFRNCPVGFNEFDENAIKEEWFRAIKSAFDGEGREKGSMTRKKKTEVQQILCTIILIGQFLSTKDDASVLTRTIPAKISGSSRTDEQIATFQRLKAHEKAGLGGILVELLQHRTLIESRYSDAYAKEFKKLTESFRADGLKVKTRIQNNFCTMLTMRVILQGHINFPFTYEEFFLQMKTDIVKLSGQIAESDSLAAFWKTMEFLADQKMIIDGYDFKIETKNEIPLIVPRSEREDGKDTKVHTFSEPKKLLYLRMNNIHPHYMNAIRQQTGKTGLNVETIVNFMKDLDGYLGMIKSTSFRNKSESKISNAYILDYDSLNLNLEKTDEPVGVERELEGEVKWNDAEVVQVYGKPKVKWLMVEDMSYEQDGMQVKNIVNITCYSEELEMAKRLTKGVKVKLKGQYVERRFAEGGRGDMIVDTIKILGPMSAPVPEDETQQEFPWEQKS